MGRLSVYDHFHLPAIHRGDRMNAAGQEHELRLFFVHFVQHDNFEERFTLARLEQFNAQPLHRPAENRVALDQGSDLGSNRLWDSFSSSMSWSALLT